MYEDIAGTQTTDRRRDYGTCAECGNVFRRRDGNLEPSGLTDDSHSEFSEVCPECERLDLTGERPLFTGPE